MINKNCKHENIMTYRPPEGNFTIEDTCNSCDEKLGFPGNETIEEFIKRRKENDKQDQKMAL